MARVVFLPVGSGPGFERNELNRLRENPASAKGPAQKGRPGILKPTPGVRGDVLRNAVVALPFLPMESRGFLESAMQPAASWPAALPVLPPFPPVPLPADTAAASVRALPAGAFPTLSAEGQVVVEVWAASAHCRGGWRHSRAHTDEEGSPVASFRLIGLVPDRAKPAPSVLAALAG
jgi:hypothetical protein